MFIDLELSVEKPLTFKRVISRQCRLPIPISLLQLSLFGEILSSMVCTLLLLASAISKAVGRSHPCAPGDDFGSDTVTTVRSSLVSPGTWSL